MGLNVNDGDLPNEILMKLISAIYGDPTAEKLNRLFGLALFAGSGASVRHMIFHDCSPLIVFFALRRFNINRIVCLTIYLSIEQATVVS